VRLALAYTRMQTLELVRFPGFTLATLGFPALLFVLFGLPRTGSHPAVVVASYMAFAVLGVGFFQFGVSAAIERPTAWAVFLRTLPAPVAVRLAGRVLTALVFAAGSVGLVVVVALATTDLSLPAGAWLRLVVALSVGSVPFITLGVAIAYWTSPKSALPVANILYLLLSFTGGLWTGGGRDLPELTARISPYTPTRQWGDVLWPAVSGGAWSWSHWAALAGFTLAFGLVAAWGYRRDEGQRFR
jgi:ABC-2 type transport system permease protein